LASRHSRRNSTDRKGIGLYTYEQVKNTTAFQYFAQIVVGAIITALGAIVVWHQVVERGEEVRKYGSSEINLWGWAVGLGGVLIGLFMAHAGAIFWIRRLVKRVLSYHKLRKQGRHRDDCP